MKRNKLSAVVIIAVFGLFSAATSATTAFADDTNPEDAAPAGSEEKNAREDGVETVPAWEAFGSGDQEVLEETFFRLSQDFVATTEIGTRRLGAVPVWPRGELKVGPVRILPYLRESLEYETNVYRRPATGAGTGFGSRGGRKHGYAWINQAGLLADTGMMGGRLRIALTADARWEQNFKSSQPDVFQLDSQLGATYRWANGAWVRGGMAYNRRSDPIEIELASNEFKRTNHNFFITAGFDKDIFFGSKAKMEVGMNVRDVRPNSPTYKAVDRTETTFHAKVSYPFWKQTTQVFVQGSYRVENRQSSSLNDGNVFSLDAGLQGNIPILSGQNRGIRGTLSFGFDHARYEDNSFTRGGRTFVNTDDTTQNTNLSIKGALQYVITNRSTVDLRLLRTNQFSTFGNYQILDRADLTYTRTITPRLTGRFAAFIEHTDPSGKDPPNVIPGDTSQGPNRNMSRGGVGLGARYKVNEWLDADMSWDYERRNAQQDRRYTDHRITLGLTFYLSAIRPKPRRERPK